MKILIISVTLLFLSTYKIAFSNNNKKLNSFGINVAILSSMTDGNFKSLGDIESCCNSNYLSSQSLNYKIDIYYKNIFYKKIFYYVDLGVIHYNDKFSNYQQLPVSGNYSKINYVEKLTMTGIQNTIALNYDYEKFGFILGFLTEVNISPKYDLYEKMILPVGGKFENGKNIRNDYYNVDATNIVNWNFGLSSLLKYEFELDKRGNKTIAPFLRVDYFLTNFHKYETLNKLNILLGVSFNYNNYKKLDSPIEVR